MHNYKKILLIGLIFPFFINAQKSDATLKAKLPITLKEASGMVNTANGFWMVNDGKTNSVFKIDTTNGSILQTIHVSNTSFIDAEALAFDKDYLYVGDVGNNDGQRKDLKIVRIKWATISNEKEVSVIGDIINISYADNKEIIKSKDQNNFDCEAIIVTNNALYLFTKRRGDYKTQLYITHKKPGNFIAKPIDYFDSMGLITDASISQDGKSLVLIGYQKKHTQSFILFFSNVAEPNFFAIKPIFISLNKGFDEWQTEGICFGKDNNILLSCEKAGSYDAAFYSFSLPKK